MTYEDLIKKYKNKKGDIEAETVLIDNNMDRKASNTVSVRVPSISKRAILFSL